ncbi:MFS transporter [Pelagerythrobacter marensis]|uniref:Major facilitator superfamily MFS_1 n=1 Tax=Pelagerythrobacter marensis TaxID=543877 RepID=A0A0G3X5P6_9SPHN|nr:MFS transporter [Pelagerythrobacter marensis]AKM06840.1 Major facilitator superfamily MFS_1 [Pelagerythrobacter marensis]
MTTSTHILRRRRFLPLFVTQLFNAFNDNLYKTAMVLFVVYSVYNSEAEEALFSAIASGVFILPFFVLSALAGQLADMRDKARIIRIVKACEIGIMIVGAAGLLIAWQDAQCATGSAGACLFRPPVSIAEMAIPLLLLALFAMGVHSTFIGPIKYAILPQHLHSDEVLAGTGLVEAGTYLAILFGTILAGWIPVEIAAGLVIAIAILGFITSQFVPPAPPQGDVNELDFPLLDPLRRSGRGPAFTALAFLPVLIADQFVSMFKLVRSTADDRRVFLAIMAISFFWTIGAVLFIQFPPLAKNVLTASKEVASLFLVIFSVGVAIGSVSVNALLKGTVSARYSPASVIVMALFVLAFYLVCRAWTPAPGDMLMDVGQFMGQPLAITLLLCLLGIAIAGGMFVVPLYAFLTTFVPKTQTARTIAANNIVNSGAMVGGALLAMGLSAVDVAIVDQLLLSAAMCLISSWLGKKLYDAEKAALAT